MLVQRGDSGGMGFPKEIWWLLNTVSGSLGLPPRPGHVDSAGLDWGAIVEGADWHHLTGILHRALVQQPQSEVPDWVRESFQAASRRHVLHTLPLLGHAIEIAKLLDREGIPFVFLKGAPLALTCYGKDLGLRPSRDIDLLVSPAHAVQVTQLLTACFGYRRARSVKPDQIELLLTNDCEWTLVREGVAVDLHWHFARVRGLFPVPIETWLARASRVNSAGYPLPTLRADDNLIYLCFHAHKHMWNRLYWALDVALLLRSNPNLFTQELFERATVLGQAVPVALGATLAEYWFGVSVNVAGGLFGSQKNLRGQLEYLFAFLRSEGDLCRWREPNQFHKWRWSTMTQPTGMKHWWHAVEGIVRPSSTDIRDMHFPRTLYFLYYLARPVRLLWAARGGFHEPE